MTKLNFAIVGYGKMGHLVERALLERGERIANIIDPNEAKVWADKSLDDVDSAICFTSPEAGYGTTKKILEGGVDAVVATTKFYLNEDGTKNAEMLEEFGEIAKANRSRMIYASNFSVGMNAFWKHLGPLAKTMATLGYDVGIDERHHNRKADVSGSAKTIGRIIIGSAYEGRKMNFGDLERKREDNEISVSSTRVGNIHRVRDPAVFAKGAIDSAYWLREQEPGVYNIGNRLK